MNILKRAAALTAIGALSLTGCSHESASSKKGREAREEKAGAVVECGSPGEALECKNLKRRLDRYNNPTKISYIYLLSETGGIYSYYTIKGKVSSNLSQMLPSDTLVDGCTSSPQCPQPVEAPGDDGSYGPNEEGIFFFTTDDVLVTWNGTYLLSDAPMKINEANLILTYPSGSKPTK